MRRRVGFAGGGGRAVVDLGGEVEGQVGLGAVAEGEGGDEEEPVGEVAWALGEVGGE